MPSLLLMLLAAKIIKSWPSKACDMISATDTDMILLVGLFYDISFLQLL